MRVVCMGTPDFAVPLLEGLLERGHEVAAVVCQPDKPVGRKRELTPPPMKVAALAHGLPVLQPTTARSRSFQARVRELAPRAVVYAAYGKILPQSFLDIPPEGCLNIHASLLPLYRGAAPIQWAIMNGEAETGVSIMRAEAGLDTGPVLLQRAEPIRDDDTAGTLFDRLASLGGRMMLEALDLIEAGEARYQPQDASHATHAPPIEAAHCRLDWSWPARKLRDRVRGLNPKPGAVFTHAGREVKLWSADLVSEVDQARSGTPLAEGCPGTVAFVGKRDLWVRSADGLLAMREVQPSGKGRISGPEFARGQRLCAGEVLWGTAAT
ncbi:MAG TPA: methionyl-tRNA formyltransferase [Armatimonadota bacterium]|jgi:methionyl-tRNA formyltransferase